MAIKEPVKYYTSISYLLSSIMDAMDGGALASETTSVQEQEMIARLRAENEELRKKYAGYVVLKCFFWGMGRWVGGNSTTARSLPPISTLQPEHPTKAGGGDVSYACARHLFWMIHDNHT